MPKIDVQTYSYLKFDLEKCCAGRLDVEISVDYGIDLCDSTIYAANVWAKIEDSKVKGFLYMESIPKEVVDRDGYIAVFHAIHESPIFIKELQSFLNWVVQSGIVSLD